MKQNIFNIITAILLSIIVIILSLNCYQLYLVESNSETMQIQISHLQQNNVLYRNYFKQIDSELFGVSLTTNRNYRSFLVER